MVILLLQSYGSIERAKQGLIFSLTMLIILGLPLGWSLKSLIGENNIRYQVNQIVREEVATFNDSDIRSIEVTPNPDKILVEMEVAATPNSINRDRLTKIKDLLTRKLDQSVELQVKIIPLETISIPDE